MEQVFYPILFHILSKTKGIEEWPADDLIWVLFIYPGLNELFICLQADTDFSNSCLKLRLI